MRLFEKAKTRLVDFFGNARTGLTRVVSKQEPASVVSAEINDRGTAPEHDGQWLIGLGTRTQAEILLPTRDGDRSRPARRPCLGPQSLTEKELSEISQL